MVTTETVERFAGTHRLLLIFAPSERDDQFDGQMLCANDYKEGFEERELVVFEILAEGESRAGGHPLSAGETESLRRGFGVADDQYLTVLIGKDGTEKARWPRAISPVDLFREIDEMPMRREEMRKER